MKIESKTKDCFHRSAAVLLVLLFTTLSAHAQLTQLTCKASPSGGGTVKAEGTLVYVTPNAGFRISSVTYDNGNGVLITLQEASMPANSTYLAGALCYLAPNTEGIVTATFAPTSNKVRVHFDMNGYGAQIDDQKLEIGQTVTRPTPDPESGSEGVAFLGWSTSRTGTSITYYDFNTVLSNSLNYSVADGCYILTLYARWGVIGGSCGTGVNWLVSKSDGSDDYDVLTISGSGEMENYSSLAKRPWHAYRTTLKTVIIEEGITYIGNMAFKDMRQLGPEVTIPASVTAIGNKAFDNCDAQTTITLAEGSQLTSLGIYAFGGEKGIRNSVSTLPASMKIIAANAFSYFKGEHLYITVPNGATLTVNGEDYSGEIKDGKADLISYLFKNLEKKRKGTPKVTTAVMADLTDYTITTDGKCTAYYNDNYANEIATARAGETVILSWDGETVPTGQYVSGFSINDGAVEVVPNEDNTDYYFIMPASNVSVTTLTSPREEYTLDLTEEEQVAIPETMFTLLNTLMGYYGGDAESMWLDINLDGTPDLQIKRPLEEDEEADSDDEFPNEYSVKRLAGADALPKNYRFTPVYPFPYRYNSILVKLGEDREVQQQMRIDEELTDSDPYDNNQSLITMHAESTEEGPINVLISGRTLYKDGYWNTLCLPFDINDFNGTPLDGATVMELDTEGTYGGHLTGLEGGTLYLNFKTVNSIEAGKPYIVKWVTPASDLKNPVFYGVSITEAVPTDVTFNGGKFCGTYAPTGIYNDEHTKYYLGAENKLYYPSAVGYQIKSFRAYFDFGADEQFAGIRAFTLNFDEDETTNIIATEDVESRMRDGVWYTLDGRRLSGKPTARGIYVNNGRKVVIK